MADIMSFHVSRRHRLNDGTNTVGYRFPSLTRVRYDESIDSNWVEPCTSNRLVSDHWLEFSDRNDLHNANFLPDEERFSSIQALGVHSQQPVRRRLFS